VGAAQGLPTKTLKCSGCSAVYVVKESERKPIKCPACGAILDTDPWRKIMRALT